MPETQYCTASVNYKFTRIKLSLVRILSNQFAAWHNDATAQPELESGNYEAFESVNSLLKALES